MPTENWHEERDRLLSLLECMEPKELAQLSKNSPARLWAAPDDISLLKKRLAQLNERLG